MSKNNLLCTVAIVAVATSSAFAADMPVKAPLTPAPPAWSWAGFYIGAHGGYGWKRNDFAEVIQTNPLLTIGGIDSNGWVAGGQAGYNWQYGRWVVGVEVDGSATGIRGDSTPVVRTFAGGLTITDVESDDVKYLGTARARLGGVPFTSWDVLLYGTAGLAWERVNRIDTEHVVTPAVTQSAVSTSPRDHFGWVAGAGAEFRLGASNWIGRLEYLHYDFGTVESTTVVSTTATGSFADSGGRQTINVVRGGLSYKFGPDLSSSPLAAYAAGMPVKAAPVSPAPPAWNWAGFYIGAHGGYGWKRNDFAEVIQTNPLLTIGGIDSNGWVAGGQFGYNWQYGRWVVGVEVDGSATGIRGDSTPVVRTFAGGLTITDVESDDVKYLGTARARLGGVPFVNPNWNVLLYGTAGLAWERVNRIDTEHVVTPAVTQSAVSTSPRDHFGWVAGAGAEFRLGASNWIGRLEYLHYDFGTVEATTTVTTTPATPGGSFADSAGRQTINVVRGGLSYKFGPDWSSSPLAAYAADMPVKAAPVSPAPPAWNWAGFYIGAHGGYGWKRNDFAEVIQTNPLLTIGGIDSNGWVAGGQAGYNWQYGRWVVGVEVDGSATGIRGDSTPVVRTFAGGLTITDVESDDVKYLGTARARLGGVPFTSWDVLLYGTAGLAWERVNRIDTEHVVTPAVTQSAVSTSPRDHFGWVAGAGAEFRLGASNWIGRLEYLHYDFGTVESTTVVSTTATGSFADSGGRQTINVVRGGLSYKFSAAR